MNLSVNPPLATPGLLPGPDSVCAGANSGLLQLSGHAGAVLRWEYSEDNFSNDVRTISSTQASRLFQNLTKTTYFRAVIGRPGCGEVFTTSHEVFASQNSLTADAGPDQTVCGGAITLTANAPANAPGVWTFVSGPAVPALSQNGASITVANMNAPGAYVFRWELDNGPCGVSSDEVIVKAEEPTRAGFLLTNTTTFCGTANSGVIALNGQTGQAAQWEFSHDGQSWAATSGQSASLSFSDLDKTTWYRAIVQNGNCTAVPTPPLEIVVVADKDAGAISGSDTVCSTGNLGQLTLSGYNGVVQRWEYAEDGQPWQTINNTGDTQSYFDLNKSRRYRAIVEYAGCPGLVSEDAYIKVDSVSEGGSVAGPAEVCRNAQAFQLSLSGQRGSVLFWEASAAQTFNPVQTINAQNEFLDISGQNQDLWYRARVQNGACPPAYSDSMRVEVRQRPARGSVSGGGAVCEGANQGMLTLNGAGGPVRRWERRPLNGGAVQTINAQTAQLPFQNLTAGYLYRAVVAGGVCPDTATAWDTVRVSPQSDAGVLSQPTTLCAGSNNGTLRLNNYTGDILRWEYSEDNFATIQTIAQTADTLAYQNLNQTRSYRAVARSGACPPAASAPVVLTVANGAAGGLISGGSSSCGSSLSGSLTLNGYSGQIQHWELSNDLTNWQVLANTTNQQSYNVSRTTYYRARISQGACPPVYSDTAKIELFAPTQSGTLSGTGVLCKYSGGRRRLRSAVI